VTGLAPLPGSPDEVRRVADRLDATARRLEVLARVLARLGHGVVWEGAAGDVAARLGGAIVPMYVLADAMEEAQSVMAVAIRDEQEAEHAYAVLEDRAYSLTVAGAGEDDPALLVVRHLQREQVQVLVAARANHRAAVLRFQEADSRCARVLRALAADDLTDSAAYRFVAGASTVGHDLATAGVAAALVPELRPLAAAGEAVGMAADAALLVAYDEGDWGDWGTAAALALTGGAGGVLRRGAVAGAEHTARGAVSTRHLTTPQRLALGAVAEAQARRDAVRAALTTPSARGTPSALIGGPVVRGPRAAPPGPSGFVPRVRDAARAGAARGRAAAAAQLDRAFRDDWRLATANGRVAQRLYSSGTGLDVGSAVVDRITPASPGSGASEPGQTGR
jgi:hypothetical protein